MATAIDWVCGDTLGLELPAHSEALQAGGAAFLTAAFQAAGSLPCDNRVERIVECHEIAGGSTGRKLLLVVAYEKPSPHLHTDLFVKFSRDFDDDARDRTRVQMALEVRFALLSRAPAFPIVVPVCYFADYHAASGTGILITQRIHYGVDGIEPQYPKAFDYRMPDPLGHYRALIKALARLAGTHKAGRFATCVDDCFPFEPAKLAVSQRGAMSAEQLRERVAAYTDFAQCHPQLLPENIRCDAFLKRLVAEAPCFHALESVAISILQSEPDLIALCHWNAHIDNAWFWHNETGEIECGLLDWGNVSQMNIAMAIWGCLSAAETDLWNCHLDELLALFIAEFRDCRGPALDSQQLKLHLIINVAMMGLTWMLDVPARALSKIPDLATVSGRFDARIESDERMRSPLAVMIAFLNLWEKSDMAGVIDYLRRSAGR